MNHPLYQLILARVREFTREPEAMADSVYSTPVPANGVLYVMTRTQLYAITAPKSEPGK